MKLELPGQPHLTYCTNIHTGETWGDIEAALSAHLPHIKHEVSPSAPMGVGLRLSARAAEELAQPWALHNFRRFLDEGETYVFTVNAFPYGSFHGTEVKEKVYEPDWRTPERVRYTMTVADILAEIAPEGIDPSISTVPGAFKANVRSEKDIERMVENLLRVGAHLDKIWQTTGRAIALAIEPEPACFLETTHEALRFIQDRLLAASGRALFGEMTGLSSSEAEDAMLRHFGLCFDVCHSAVAFEETIETLNAVRASGIAVAKLQLSSALSVEGEASDFEPLLESFNDGIYLHQTVERRDGRITRHTDLPDAFAAARRGEAGGEWRVHCHVPVFRDRFDGLGSTQENLRSALALCRAREVSPHLEVETYTWSVLPRGVRHEDLGQDIVRELGWVRAELGA